VWSRLSATFGVGFGEQKKIISRSRLTEVSGGYNCYWAMPFISRLLDLTNRSKSVWMRFTTTLVLLTTNCRKRRFTFMLSGTGKSCKPGQNYTILDAKGRGHFVEVSPSSYKIVKDADLLSGGDEDDLSLEGEKDANPLEQERRTIFRAAGTDRGEYGAPYHGINLKDTENGRISTYRWHIEDAMPFKEKHSGHD
jgi:hypothetical protein